MLPLLLLVAVVAAAPFLRTEVTTVLAAPLPALPPAGDEAAADTATARLGSTSTPRAWVSTHTYARLSIPARVSHTPPGVYIRMTAPVGMNDIAA